MKRILSILALLILLWGHADERVFQAGGPELLLIGAFIGAGSYVMQGMAMRQQAKTTEALMEYNAAVSEREGEEKQRQAEIKAERFQEQAAELEAEQVASYGKAGVLFRGSPLTVMAQTAKSLELDRQMILREGEVGKKFSEAEATAYRLQGKAARIKGRYAMLTGGLEAGATALTGLGKYKS